MCSTMFSPLDPHVDAVGEVRSSYLHLSLPQSSSASRFTAGGLARHRRQHGANAVIGAPRPLLVAHLILIMSILDTLT